MCVVQPSRQLDPSGRWVAPTPQQGSFFSRPSKATASSSLASQGFSNQPYKPSGTVPSHGSAAVNGPSLTSWNVPGPNGQVQHSQSLPDNTFGATTSAPVPAKTAGSQGRWAGFTNMFSPTRAQGHKLGSGALLDHADPVLSSIAESDTEAGVVDDSLHAYHSTDLDAATAAASANRLWSITAPSLSPRRNASASPGSDSHTDSQTGSYPVPSPWSSPVKPAQSSPSPSQASYPVPSPQNAPLGQTHSQRQSPAVSIGPFEAAARARAAQSRAGSSSPGNSTISPQQANPSQAGSVQYPVPSPSSSGQQQLDTSPQTGSSSSRALFRASPSRSMPNRPSYPVPSPGSDWSTGMPGMSTTKAARSSSVERRRKRL